MAKKKHKKSSNYSSRNVLLAVICALSLLLLIVSIAYVNKASETETVTSAESEQTGSIASIGSMQYDFSSGKAVKRTDESLSKLKKFLITEGNKSVGPNCPTVYHNVIIASPDEKQVLLGYGCGDPGSRMFAVEKEGNWKTLSPTNQFDLFGIPLCDHVNSDNIDRSIAPVCATELTERISYEVR